MRATLPGADEGALRALPGTLEVERRGESVVVRTTDSDALAPTLFFLIFGLNGAYADLRAGKGNVSASVLISMALYGAVLATTSGGAMVSLERSAGWTRTLRVTPLSSAAYIAIKMVASLVLGSASVAVVYVVGAASGKPVMPLWVWIVSAVATWIGSLVFTAFGLFVGYLLPSENVMQIIGFTLMLFSFGGGLFIPLSQYSPTLRTLAELTPLWGLNGLVHFPLMGGAFDVGWVANLLAWLVLFSLGAVWRFGRATSRV
ncbi:MAG TPA: ABC transporter permease [Acidimicrobiales bacterium]|nr:ABC transporter permease [Acidimicrobiales bacterium]